MKINDELFDYFKQAGTIKHYQKNDIIYMQDDHADELCLVLKGRVRVYHITKNGNDNCNHLTQLLKWAQTYDRFEKVAAFLYELSATNNIEKNLLFGDIPYTHQEIADSLAISRVTVTKVLNQFKDEGLISIEYGHIKVLKRDKLYEQYLSTLV